MSIARARGVVVRGLGVGRYYVEIYREKIRRALGIDPYGGTLNIVLDNESLGIVEECLNGGRAVVIEPPAEGYGKVYAWLAKLRANSKELGVYVIRPEKTRHGGNVIEIISDRNLREVLGLSDGDWVELYVYC